MELKYAIDPDSAFQKKLEQVYAATRDLTAPLIEISREWFKGNKSIFALKGKGRYQDLSVRPLNAFWEKDKRLREIASKGGYKAYKMAKYNLSSPYPILFATGTLKNSITNGSDANSVNLIINKSTLVLGTKVPYAIYHQSDQPRTKIPYRPFLFVGVEQIAPNDIKNKRLENWIKILDRHFEQSIKK